MKHLYPLPFMLLYFGLIFNVSAQNSDGAALNKSRQSSSLTLIYKITNDEAEKIYRHSAWVVDSSFFHSPIDAYPTDSTYSGELPPGHYLRRYTLRDKEKYDILTVQDFEIYLLNNNEDLRVQVYSLEGNLISDADLRIRGKNLKFDKKTKSYVDRKSNRLGILEVSWKGLRCFYDLDRAYNNSAFRRNTRTLLYGTPVKYVWRPVKFILSIPVDGYRSVKHHGAQGSIWSIRNFFVNVYEKVACLFDSYYCNDDNYSYDQLHTGYLVFNKPKYRQGDTVMLKAFVTTKKGKPYKHPVILQLHDYRDRVTFDTLSAYRQGAYTHQFVLHDSLNLKLDRTYRIALLDTRKKKEILLEGSFSYEDYELKSNNLSIRTSQDQHSRNSSIQLFMKGTDENMLNLADARVRVLITPKRIEKTYRDYVFIPDTLFYKEMNLQPSGETELTISDVHFPEADLDYVISVTMLTSDNEHITKDKTIKFLNPANKLEVSLETDSVVFLHYTDGKLNPATISVKAEDHFGNSTTLVSGTTPLKLPVNPFYARYIARSDSASHTLDLASTSSLLQVFARRTRDSVFVMVDNPRGLHFTYDIFKKNQRKISGTTDSLDLSRAASGNKAYFISVRYLWGGEIISDDYSIPLLENALNISVNAPDLVFPGQTTSIKLKITDVNDKPVRDADVTAFSVTSKFGYSPPSLPTFNKAKKDQKKVINNFQADDISMSEFHGVNLNYDEWKILSGIDSIEYYKFTFPESGYYEYRYIPSDSLTQFAPFVVEDGSIKPVHIVYVDNRPVYFSWSTNNTPYSFHINPGYRQITLRTTDREIVIDSVHIRKNEKLVFSIVKDAEIPNVSHSRREPELSAYEKRAVYPYIFPYRDTFGEKPAYLTHYNEVVDLSSPGYQNTFRTTNLAGPVRGFNTFHLYDDYETQFQHEGMFEYDFAKGLIKMRSIPAYNYPAMLSHYPVRLNTGDEVLTEKIIFTSWQLHLDNRRRQQARFNHPLFTGPGKGALQIRQKISENNQLPLNLVLFKTDDLDFIRVYAGNSTDIHNLLPATYRLIYFYPGARYQIVDSVRINQDGLTIIKSDHSNLLNKDTFSIEVNKIIQQIYDSNQTRQPADSNPSLNRIKRKYIENMYSEAGGNLVRGVVISDEDGSVLPGVNVVVKGTTVGTVSDINGEYELIIPPGYNELVFSFVGLLTEEVRVDGNNLINVHMASDVTQLSEVVVTGYGVQSRKELTTAVSTVTVRPDLPQPAMMNSLQGRVAGVTITSNAATGTALRISVRGASAIDFENKPLYVINGVIYSGNIEELNPNLIREINILKGQDAVALYGARGANGVVIVTTKDGSFVPVTGPRAKGADYDEEFLTNAMESSSIRKNFSDYAFWQPALRTDENGEVSFEVIFPDDVTSWQTVFMAMTDKKQSGHSEGSIKSYKPLMARLAVPRFLVEGDTTSLIGKALNYLPDSVEIETSFRVKGHLNRSFSGKIADARIDTLHFIAEQDSASVEYKLQTRDNYFDGEEKEIPVFRKGLEKVVGSFIPMDRDTVIDLSFQPEFGPATLYARADLIEVFEEEILHVRGYLYNCNEQISSKLVALLAQRKIEQVKGLQPTVDREIEKLIRLLEKNQNENGLWGWWKNSADNYWISRYILENLELARSAGFTVSVNREKIVDKMIWEMENSPFTDRKIDILDILTILELKAGFNEYILQLEKESLSLTKELRLIRLRQKHNLPYSLDSLLIYERKTLFGNIYYSRNDDKHTLTENDIENTLLMYTILENDTSAFQKKLSKISNYFLEKRGRGHWRNTYESARLINTLLPRFINVDESKTTFPELVLSGALNETITEFPIERSLSASDTLQISKAGNFPVYLTAYQRYWDASPKEKKNDFRITTSFSHGSNQINEGEEVTLVAEVHIDKDAEYVMINIPIPGGCSYAEKPQYFMNEAHREYFRNETAIFSEKLRKGVYKFEVRLIARYTGVYTLNPAKVELMYYPTFSANNESRNVRID